MCSSSPGLAPLCGLGAGLLATPTYWLGAVLIAPAVALLADFSLESFQRLAAPRASQVLQVRVIVPVPRLCTHYFVCAL